MDIYEWERTILLDLRDFIVYWKKHPGRRKFPTEIIEGEMSYSNWVKEFNSFNEDRQ